MCMRLQSCCLALPSSWVCLSRVDVIAQIKMEKSEKSEKSGKSENMAKIPKNGKIFHLVCIYTYYF